MIPPPPSQVRAALLLATGEARGVDCCLSLLCCRLCSSVCTPSVLSFLSPLQPEDVEHWAAAHGMQAAAGSADGGGGTATAAAALYGSSPMARLRAFTRTYLPLGSAGGSGGGGG